MKFKYTAADKTGTQIQGEWEAPSREDVVNYLHQKDLMVISIEENVALNFKELSQIQIGGFSLKDKLIVTKQLVAMLQAGLPLTQAMDVLKDQAPKEAMKEQLAKVHADLQNGSPLSASFHKNTKIFSEVQINLINAGEKSGNLVEILTKVADDMEKANKLKSKIKGAMIYPAIIVTAIIGVMIILIVFMVPQMEKLYADFGIQELPAVTKMIVGLGNFMTSLYGLLTAILIVLGVIASSYYYKSTDSGKRIFHRIALKLPIFGGLNEKIQVAEFSRLLALLLSSGVPIIDALNIVAKSTSNMIYSDSIRIAAKKVSKGVPLAVPLAQENVFPKVFTRVVAVGEETGKLDQILVDMSKFYDNEVNEIADSLTKLLEPIILLVVAGLVGFLAVAVYWPIYSLGQFL